MTLPGQHPSSNQEKIETLSLNLSEFLFGSRALLKAANLMLNYLNLECFFLRDRTSQVLKDKITTCIAH